MTEEALKEPEVDAILEQQRSARVPQHVRREMDRYAGLLGEGAKRSPHGLRRPILSIWAQERCRIVPGRKLDQEYPQPFVHHEDAPFAPPFAAHMQTSPLLIEVPWLQLDEFRYTQTRRDQQEHCGSE
jgi:hypothetical protein